MSTPNPLLTAAAPELIAALQAIQTFIANMGPDPAQWMLKFPGASQVLLGTVQMQVPTLATAEGAALQAQANAQIAKWIEGLQKAAG